LRSEKEDTFIKKKDKGGGFRPFTHWREISILSASFVGPLSKNTTKNIDAKVRSNNEEEKKESFQKKKSQETFGACMEPYLGVTTTAARMIA